MFSCTFNFSGRRVPQDLILYKPDFVVIFAEMSLSPRNNRKIQELFFKLFFPAEIFPKEEILLYSILDLLQKFRTINFNKVNCSL